MRDSEIAKDFYQRSCIVAKEMNKVSTSLFQRRFKIGYGVASRIVDLMEERGFCSMPAPRTGKRTIL